MEGQGTIGTGVSARLPARLRKAGLRPTMLRLNILEAFERHGAPMSCEAVFRSLAQADIPGSFSGIQRNIQELMRAGLLRALSEPDRSRPRTLYEFIVSPWNITAADDTLANKQGD